MHIVWYSILYCIQYEPESFECFLGDYIGFHAGEWFVISMIKNITCLINKTSSITSLVLVWLQLLSMYYMA